MPLTDATIVVAEDTYDDRELVSAILSLSGVNVRVVKNGRDCIDLVNEIQPTLVITDLSMPEMDGWQVLKHIRAEDSTSHIPVVAITAYYSADVANDAKEAGFNAFFAKPVSASDFVTHLEKLV
ncbi:MAG: response regulator [Chloroflexota bacterium]